MRPESIKMLSGKSQSYEKQGDPGEGALRPEDVAGALGHADPAAAMFGRLVYADQVEFVEQLRRDMVQHLAGDAEAQKWKLPRPGWIGDMCSLALIEAMLESQIPADHQALFMRMPFWEWNRRWRPAYQRCVVALVDEWRWRLNDALRREG